MRWRSWHILNLGFFRIASVWYEWPANCCGQEHRDLWLLFWQQLSQVDLACCHIQWIPSRRSWSALQGAERSHAWFNHWVDQAAKAALGSRDAALYRAHATYLVGRQSLVLELARFQAQVALAFAQQATDSPAPVPVELSGLCPCGPSSSIVLLPTFAPVSSQVFSAVGQLVGCQDVVSCHHYP